MKLFFKAHSQSIFLLFALLIGSACGLFLKDKAILAKPFGDVFLNLLFTLVVPLVFFSISSTLGSMTDLKRLGKITSIMMLIFISSGVIASCVMLIVVKIFTFSSGIHLELPTHFQLNSYNIGESIVKTLTVSDFKDLFSKQNMLALIVFSILSGISCAMAGHKAKVFLDFLNAGNEVMSKIISLVMLYAPIGLGAYFAYLVGVFGPQLLGSYAKVVAIYYPVALLYGICMFSLLAFIAHRYQGLKSFWSNIIPVIVTAFATGSSVATIPSNLEVARKIGIPKEIRDIVIPIGATIHMEGSCLSAILKISLLFGIFGIDFNNPTTYLLAIIIAILSGTVMSGIPGGGFLGELLIITMYGFPIEALPLITMVGILVDPPATMINAVGDSSSGMLISRIVYGKDWKESVEPSS